MSDRIRISQSDQFRPLLTELLPYEAPYRFSADTVFSACNARTLSENLKSLLIGEFPQDGENVRRTYESYKYEIFVRNEKSRTLSIIHPQLYSRYLRMYSEHALDIVSLCRKSEFSLRCPKGVARTYRPQSVFYDSVLVEPNEVETVESTDKIQSNFSSFFSYGPFTHVAKFYESRKYVELESRFRYCLVFDVAKCFDSIYTHSIAWAIRTRKQAKREKGSKTSFHAVFDELIRDSNSGETHGIVVGAEVSRIFAEIIFQQIDSDTASACRKLGIRSGPDFEIRRYVDDYFLFYNEREVATQVRSTVEKCLSQYKLYLNEVKDASLVRPFETKISIAKDELETSIKSFFKECLEGEIRGALILRIRRILSAADLNYSDCGIWIASKIHEHLRGFVFRSRHGNASSQFSDSQRYGITEAVEATFFIFSVEPKFRIGTILLKIIVVSGFYSGTTSIAEGGVVRNCVRNEIRRILRDISDGERISLEFLCVLAALCESSMFHPIPIDLLRKCAPLTALKEDYGYFELVSFLTIFESHSSYSAELGMLKVVIVEKLKECADEELLENTEYFLMSIELVSRSCFNLVDRRKVARRILRQMKNETPSQDEVRELVEDLETLQPFYNRSEAFTVARQIAKKELAFVY